MVSVFGVLILYVAKLTLGLESPISFNIEHSLDGGLSFLPFKEIEVRPSIGFISLSNNATHLSDLDKRTLIDTAKQDKLYVLRMNLSGSRFLESSLLACQLISSQFRLQLIVSLDEVGFPIGLHASASKYACPLSVDSTELLVSSIPSEFPVKIDVQKPIVGASPETTRYLQRLEKQREEMARAEKGENKSFFAKYWTYIVLGLVIFVVMSAAQEASTATGNAGGGGGGNRQ